MHTRLIQRKNGVNYHLIEKKSMRTLKLHLSTVAKGCLKIKGCHRYVNHQWKVAFLLLMELEIIIQSQRKSHQNVYITA